MLVIKNIENLLGTILTSPHINGKFVIVGVNWDDENYEFSFFNPERKVGTKIFLRRESDYTSEGKQFYGFYDSEGRNTSMYVSVEWFGQKENAIKYLGELAAKYCN